MLNFKNLITALAIFSFGLSTTGCFESDAENAAEDVGEKIEDTADRTADEVEDAADEIDD